MPQEDFRLKHPTHSDELRAQRGDGAELPTPVQKRRRTLTETLDETIRALRRQPTREQEQERLLAIEERPVDASRIAPKNQRAIIERFQTVDDVNRPNVHELAPHLMARREQQELERTWVNDVLDRVRERPQWVDILFVFFIFTCSFAFLAFVLSKYVL